jgi:HTH-type transcriptional regulator / antitoxin HigA
MTKSTPLPSDVRPIRSEADYRSALEEIEALFDAPVGSPEADRLEVLATLVHAYEERTIPMRAPDPVEALLYFMESRGISKRDVEACIGSRGRLSEVLNRKRPLTIGMIRRLHERLGISADLLIGAYPLARAS